MKPFGQGFLGDSDDDCDFDDRPCKDNKRHFST